MVALDKKTGDTIWRTDRPSEYYADIAGYLRKAYHTPVLVDIDGETQLVSNGSQVVTGNDPATGEEIWRVVYGGDNTVSRIVANEDLMFINCGSNEHRLWAVRKGGQGDITESHVAWKLSEDVSLEPSPVLVDGLLYMVSDAGVLSCIEAETGNVIWTEKLRGKFGASLLYADGKIYAADKRGQVTVIKPGRTFELLATNQLDGAFWASPALARNSLLLRTKTHLYRIASE